MGGWGWQKKCFPENTRFFYMILPILEKKALGRGVQTKVGRVTLNKELFFWP